MDAGGPWPALDPPTQTNPPLLHLPNPGSQISQGNFSATSSTPTEASQDEIHGEAKKAEIIGNATTQASCNRGTTNPMATETIPQEAMTTLQANAQETSSIGISAGNALAWPAKPALIGNTQSLISRRRG